MSKGQVNSAVVLEVPMPEQFAKVKESISEVAKDFKGGLQVIVTDTLKAEYKEKLIEDISTIGKAAYVTFGKFKSLFDRLNNPDVNAGIILKVDGTRVADMRFSKERLDKLDTALDLSKKFNEALLKAYAKDSVMKDWDILNGQTKKLNTFVEANGKK